jgi:hypothetical protein
MPRRVFFERSRIMRGGHLAVAVGVAVAMAWPAQVTLAGQVQALEAGTRVRVTLSTRSESIIGTVQGWSQEVLTVESDETREELAVPRDSLSSIERSQGMRSKARTGAVIGLVGGAGLGYAISACDYGPGCLDDMELIVAPALGLVGAGLGALIGAASREEVWMPVALSIASTGAVVVRFTLDRREE